MSVGCRPLTNPITQINAGVPAHLSKLSREKGFSIVYISTDYVFNGRKLVISLYHGDPIH